MQKIIPHIWFETQAHDAAVWYTSLFKNSKINYEATIPDTPSGDAKAVSLQLLGQDFHFLSAGPLFERNPSFSYMISCATKQDVDELWNKLIAGGQALMPLDAYPFSERFGWLVDKFGVSWQVILYAGQKVQPITPVLLFTQQACGHAEEEMQTLIKLVGDGEVLQLQRYGAGGLDKEGTIQHARFRLGKQEFVFMDSAMSHAFTFNEMQSLMIYVDSQAEIDRYTQVLSAVPESEQCGWVKDRFGVSWQITPARMEQMMAKGSHEQIARVTKAFLPMKKLDLAALERAFAGK